MVTRKDYPAEAVEAALSALVEVAHALGAYADHMVLVGGWVPRFTMNNEDDPNAGLREEHVGELLK